MLQNHAGYAAAVEKLQQLRIRQASCAAKHDQLLAEFRDARGNGLQREVDALLGDGPATGRDVKSLQDEITATRRASAVLAEAIRQQQVVVDEQIGAASVEICTAALDAHREIVAALDQAIREVDRLALEEMKFRADLERDGVRLVGPMTVARPHYLFAAPRQLKSDLWRKQMVEAGYLEDPADAT